MKALGAEKNLNLGSEDNITIRTPQTHGTFTSITRRIPGMLGCYKTEGGREYRLGTTLDVKPYHSDSFGTSGPKRASFRLEFWET